MSTFDLVSVSMAGIAPALVFVLNVLAIIASTALALCWGVVPQTFNVEAGEVLDLEALTEKHLLECLEAEAEAELLARGYDPVDVPIACPPVPVPPVLLDWSAPMPSITEEVRNDLDLQEEIIAHTKRTRAMTRPSKVVKPARRPMWAPMKTVIPEMPPEWGIWDHAIGAYAAPWAVAASCAMSGI